MSTTTPAQPETPQPQRVKKRIYIPLILLVLLIVIAVVFYVRGTWADKEEHNPSGPDAGTITQLLQRPNGNVVVRCVVIVDAPPKDVWAVINDYASHKDFLPYVTKVEATPQKDGKILIDGVAYSRLWQEWPFQSLVTNKENPDDGEYSALWSEEDKGEFKVNRGGWSLKPHKSKKQTQLEFALQIELQKYPSFLVRDIIMDRLHSVLKAMRDETLRRREKNKA